MMKLINKIGQRRFAKILVAVSFLFPLIGFMLEKGSGALIVAMVWISAITFSLPNLLLSLAAHKSKEYRFISIVISIAILIVNTCLLYLQVYSFLFFISILEIIFGIVFLTFVKIAYKNKKKTEKIISNNTRRNTIVSRKDINEDDNE